MLVNKCIQNDTDALGVLRCWIKETELISIQINTYRWGVYASEWAWPEQSTIGAYFILKGGQYLTKWFSHWVKKVPSLNKDCWYAFWCVRWSWQVFRWLLLTVALPVITKRCVCLPKECSGVSFDNDVSIPNWGCSVFLDVFVRS